MTETNEDDALRAPFRDWLAIQGDKPVYFTLATCAVAAAGCNPGFPTELVGRRRSGDADSPTDEATESCAFSSATRSTSPAFGPERARG